MLNKVIKTLDTVSKVVETVDRVATTTNNVVNVINSSSKSNALEVVNTAVDVMKVISDSDIDYLLGQPKSDLNSILAGMTGLMNENDMKVEMLESQKWYSRMIKTVTGKNSATKDEIRRNHDQLNMYMSQAVGELYNRNCVDHRAMISLGNQMNSLCKRFEELYIDNLELRSMLGNFVAKLNEKIESVDNFHILSTEISQGVYSRYSSVEAICSILSQLDNRTLMDNRKMGIIERSIRKEGIINDEKISLVDFFKHVEYISYDNVGIIYMDQSNTRGNFISNLILNIFDKQSMLLGDGSEYYSNVEYIKGFIENEYIDNDIQLSTSEIYNELIKGKFDKMNGLSPISELQYECMLKEGQRAYIDYDIEYAKDIFTDLAEKNVKRAMYFLDEIYSNGYGSVEKDNEKSLYWRAKGYDISSICDNGFRYVLSLAQQNDVFAQYEVANMYYHGYGTQKDLNQYIYWINASSINGYFKAIKNLADCYYFGNDVDKNEYQALKLYEKAAMIGEFNSQNILANYYYNGEMVNQNYEEAVKWYKKSASQGHYWAQSNLANCYRDGKGVEQNYNEVFRLNLEAAKGGIGFAQYEVGYCYINGLGTKINYAEGYRWYEKAANNGNIAAMLALGDYHLTGILKSKSKAFEYYQKAAKYGDARGQKELGNCYRDGIGTKVDYLEALKWYNKSAEQGFASAMTNIGWLYLYGKKDKGIVKNKDRSIYWYTKGAKAGSAVSQYALADFYYRGDGVKKDREEARCWYVKSAKGGNKEAKKALKKYFNINM